MRLILNHIQNAYESLRANRMRTFLTITGVAIGIASPFVQCDGVMCVSPRVLLFAQLLVVHNSARM